MMNQVTKPEAVTALINLLVRDVRKKIFTYPERTALKVILNNLEEWKINRWTRKP